MKRNEKRTLVENIAGQFNKAEHTSNKRARKLVHDHDCKVNTNFHNLSKLPSIGEIVQYASKAIRPLGNEVH